LYFLLYIAHHFFASLDFCTLKCCWHHMPLSIAKNLFSDWIRFIDSLGKIHVRTNLHGEHHTHVGACRSSFALRQLTHCHPMLHCADTRRINYLPSSLAVICKQQRVMIIFHVAHVFPFIAARRRNGVEKNRSKTRCKLLKYL
jgi:hypothetical protein